MTEFGMVSQVYVEKHKKCCNVMYNFVTQSGNAVHVRLCILCADHLLIVKIGPKNQRYCKNESGTLFRGNGIL